MSPSGRLVGIGAIIACLAFLAGHLMGCAHGTGRAGEGSSRRIDAAGPPEAVPASPVEPAAGAQGEPSGAEAGGEDTAPGEAAGGTSGLARASGESDLPEVGGPRIQFDEDTFDFGGLYQSEEVSHEFAFTNVGEATLKIAEVKSTCRCTAAAVSGREIGPGKSGAIKATLQTGTLRGQLTKRVYVYTNDPIEPRATLTITAEVKQEIEVQPTGIHIGRMKVGEVVERSVMIRPVELKSFSILGVETNHPALSVSDPVRLPGESSRYELRIRFGPVDEPGRVNAKVRVQTDLEHTAEIAIPVYGRVVEREKAG